jgi:hypothetical protein
MAYLTEDFDIAVEPSLIIYAFREGLLVPEVVSFSFKTLAMYQGGFHSRCANPQ